MPMWCHMFNSTLIGTARVWFDELPPKSIDGYKDLKAAFLAYFMQQKKYIKDPVEIHNIKQKDGETIEDFMERFKVETGRMKGAPECMRISGFMHGVNNPELTKRLNEHVPKTMEEMMTVTTAFIRGETAAASKKKGHAPWKPQDQPKRHVSKRNSDFRGHSTDECMQLKKQIEELVRAGKLSHLIKEIKQGRDQTKVGKKEAPAKDKSLAIYMVQPWHRTTRQKVTQSFARVSEITFPPLTTSKGTEGPLVIEAEIGGHMIHRMLLVTIGDADNATKAWMNFMIVRSLSPYNGIIGRPEIREIQAVPSTAHRMLKFPVNGGIVTILALHPNFSDQEVSIGGTLYAKGRMKLCSLLKENLDIFSWQPSDMTGVPRSVAEHRLNIREGYSPVRQKKRGQPWNVPKPSKRSLKNAGATYQQLMDKAFDSQVGRNIEVYVDDLVIKSHTEAKMIRDINETPEGIKLCPDKTESVLQLPSPRTIKEVQSLNGKLASLNRFLSKSAENSLPLFKTLKKCIKKSEFHWTPDMEQAFKQLKQHLLELPLLILVDFLAEKPDESPPDTSVVETPFQFIASNNEAEYEALIDGLRIAAQIGVLNVHVSVDSKLVANQVLGAYVAKEENMIKYLEKVKSLKEVTTVVEEDGLTWMTPIIEYLKEETLPVDKKEARKLRIKAMAMWGINIVGPFPVGLGKVKFLIVAMDYFTKWIEAKALSTITGNQSNRLVERANRSMGDGIKARLGEGNKNWIEELPHVLWAYCTMIKSSHDDTPFSLTYGYKAVIPAEIGMPKYHTTTVDAIHNDEVLRLNLDLLEERRERAAICEAKAKLQMTKYYNARVRGVTFRPEDFVYCSNDASHAVAGGKLGPKWEGPYEVTEALEDGAYRLRSMDGTILLRT
ncbi:reverse transcriptase domain-containing protein [Tanacetum coccineum]